MIPAIPTTYRNVRFRSRLEAKWAAFFDLLGWPWLYEPIDLNGYIPDFILQLPNPVLVEVKPAFSFDELRKHTAKIDASGWEGECLLVGACLLRAETWDRHSLGLLGQFVPAHEAVEAGIEAHFYWYDPAILIDNKGHAGFNAEYNSYSDRVAEDNDWKNYKRLHNADALWAKAGNIVQWKAA